ncbi:C-X-C chemokine receptor type 5 isoform X2 [Channa argus]|uniref:C-X-C chemokine receptor type 5 isoform X2 n=1 Tax=Channa argus TaxID=215402 RepID=UPI0029489F23|nr:hypothetical protein Q8A73_007074 [Channa argus]
MALDKVEDYDNYSIDYENETFCDREIMDMKNQKLILYSFIFVLGVAGNGLMITVLLRRLRFLRITEIYLLHLALADLMLLFTFPFDVVDCFSGWVFGGFLCKLVGLLRHLNVSCGSFLLACIGFDRYLAIVHAIPSMQSRRRRTVHLTCIVLWLFCLGLSIPNVVFLRVDLVNTSAPSCSFSNYEIHASNWVLTKRLLDHICFFLPLAVMSYCYTAVVVTLCKSQKSQAKKGAIRLALLVTVIFFICWLPYNITLLIQTLEYLEVFRSVSCYSYILHLETLGVTEILGFSHCCLNPFLYAFVGVRFRNELLQLLCKLGCSRVCVPFIELQSHRRASISEGLTTISSNI